MRKKRNRRGRQDGEPIPKEKIKLIDLFDIPQASLTGIAQIEMSGNQEAVIDGCQGVLEYDEGVIKLACGSMSVKFTGRNLQIRVLTHDSAIIGGFITNVEFIS